MDEEDELFRTLYPSLRRFAAVTGSYDVDHDDLVQDVVTRVLRRRRLTELDHPAAYLRRTILNLASDGRRGRARWRSAMARRGADPDTIPTDYPSDLDHLLQLDPQDRAVLFLCCPERSDGVPSPDATIVQSAPDGGLPMPTVDVAVPVPPDQPCLIRRSG